MCQQPPDGAIRGMLGAIASPDITIKKCQLVPSLRPQRIYEVTLSDDRTVQLVLPPPAMWRPLRSEQDLVTAEAAAVRWITETLAQQDGTTKAEPEEQRSFSPSSSTSRPTLLTTPLSPASLFLPTLLHNGQDSPAPSSAFAIYAPPTTTSGDASKPSSSAPLSLLAHPPSAASQHAIDLHLGRLFRQLASLTSPTGRFGPLAAVLNATPPRTVSYRHQLVGPGRPGRKGSPGPWNLHQIPRIVVEGSLAVTRGAGTWSVAFHSMLEAVLRDGEDMGIVMPYPAVRRQFRRLGYLLDEVTVGRLVVVGALGRGNVLVEGEGGWEGVHGGDRGEDGEEMGKGAGKEGGEVAGGCEEEKGVKEGGEEEIIKEETDTQEDQQQQPRTPPKLKLAGLRDWSSCVFGDPLFATVFSDPQQHQQPPQPSASFLEGFNEAKPEEYEPNILDRDHRFPLDTTLIEGIETAWIRLFLYQAYHAVTRVITEFYRPRQDSSARELAARRRLNQVLAWLAEVPDDVKRRHHRPSGDMSPAKRLKGDEEVEGS
ncbi:hypothetical protein C8A05DRAFT_40931 [Staphylotrichum tortipilum]|uniref:Uncharacterized protein n=1 Tax=Staphylotrichum tortipilum TaxID=2831512 RepID=A0AAN6MSF0_9PEZI|nr:hypothetical protein C8A05DRAFT_40931 [Staphylotrichum longicolle]